ALIYSATARLKTAIALSPPMDTVGSRGLVIGGGLVGLEAARCLAEAGFGVDVIEKNEQLGGMANLIKIDIEGNDFEKYMKDLLRFVNENDLVTIHKNTTLVDVSGYAGNFHINAETKEGDRFKIDPAVVFIATGAKQNNVNAYEHGEDERIMTQLELTDKINGGVSLNGHVAMIQCVGSRNNQMPYCSRVCCSHALKNALLLKKQGVDVTIFYRDMNTYGFKDDYYREAINEGIKFIRFDKGRYPALKSRGDSLDISYKEYVAENDDILSADYLILSVGIVPDKQTNEKLSKMFNIGLDEDGFYESESCACPYEDAAKRLMKPFELASNGVFPIGLVHSPRSLSESLLMARQAAGKALIFLPNAKMPPPNAMYVSEVDTGKCTGCGLCVKVCSYNARSIDPVTKKAVVHPFLCDSCGACVVACPSGASFLRDHREEQMISSIDALLAAG
ncbi:MAG: CoB--CoM heterodisulfide reductase iron-sulfur subunit A family protein, partial [Desulfobacterales bacterium]|nr:CoB--CoM heterodisulfide reductase iron-sulfur subunit A family protein [Desulfobacterales bacterium]